MSQDINAQAQVAETSTQETRTFIRQVRAKTRRKYAPEDKIRIVLEGFRSEVTVRDLCRREGIKPGVFYAWTKEFMEAGKERLTRDCWQPAKVGHFCLGEIKVSRYICCHFHRYLRRRSAIMGHF